VATDRWFELRARAAALLERPGVRRWRAWLLRRRKVLLGAALACGILAMVIHWS
jgi:hypothetical protein